MVLKYTEITVNGTANQEKTSTLVTSTEEEKKQINKLYITETTGTLQGDAVLKIYVERERIVDMSIKHLLESSASNTKATDGVIEINLKLPVGQELIVGHTSGATTSNIKFAAQWQVYT